MCQINQAVKDVILQTMPVSVYPWDVEKKSRAYNPNINYISL
jgi:hypothetical protein